MKTYRISSTQIDLPPGKYECKGHFMSVPWITTVDNFDMTDEELIEWMHDEPLYILEVYNAGY